MGCALLGKALVPVLALGLLQSGDAFVSLTVQDSITVNSTRPLIFPVTEGVPGYGTLHLVKLGGDTDADIFLSLVDGQAGVDDATQGRMFVQYARPATPSAPVSGTSHVLGGWFWDGTSSTQRAIELENKVRPNGTPEFWLEEISEGEGHPFMRMASGGTNIGLVSSHDQPGSTLRFRGVNNALIYSDVAKIQGAAIPYWEFAPTGYRLLPTTRISLPACNSTRMGWQAYVTDSTTATWGAIVPGAGGGPYAVGVSCNGTSWKVASK